MANKLWTKDFTIITLGSVVSMLGNAMSGFAMSLLVLDYTGSTLYYAIFLACFTLPQLVMPIFSGAILDRFSRKKTIYSLDYLSSGLYLLFALILFKNWFNFPMLAIGCIIIGSIESIYCVAYDSFYPLLISEGNYQKAYSVASTLETLTFLMIPVSTFFYNKVGVAPLMLFNAVTFFLAATMETKIEHDEKYIEKQKQNLLESGEEIGIVKLMFRDIKEGFAYLKVERGLLFIALYFFVSNFAGSASQVVGLPYFKAHYDNGAYVFILVMGCSVLFRAVGGMIHYTVKLPVKYKFYIALLVYVCISIFEGAYLYFPIPVMMILCALTGIGGVTSYTIRISATQSYVPDERKGRFNGAFNLLLTGGAFIGELAAGALSEVVPDVRMVVSIFMGINLFAAIFFIGGNKKYIKPIYNTQN